MALVLSPWGLTVNGYVYIEIHLMIVVVMVRVMCAARILEAGVCSFFCRCVVGQLSEQGEKRG